MSSPRLDYLILAPHATVPAHDGASVRSNEMALAWLDSGRSILMVAKHGNLTSASQLRVGGVPQKERSKRFSAVCALLRFVSYNAGKHVTGEWLSRARQALKEHDPKIVYVHFLWTLPSLWNELKGREIWLDTHNFDNEWFGNMGRNSKNPLVWYLAKLSASYSLKALHRLRPTDHLVHVTESDSERYFELHAGPRHTVIPNGCRIRPRKKTPDYSQRKQLYFLGLLSAKMNYDGLAYFSEFIWPSIKDKCDFFVIGKSPSPAIHWICGFNQWTLIPDIPGPDLDALLEKMHFAVMPFVYSAGSKAKLMDAAGRGIPILATSDGVKGYAGMPPEIHVLSSPQEWLKMVDGPCETPDAESLLKFARTYEWSTLGRAIDQQMLGQ